jgi:hypothetical protein
VGKVLGNRSLHSKHLSLPGLPPHSHISFMWFLELLSSDLLMYFVFLLRVHLFPDTANSELRESVAMIVGLFVRVVLSIAVMIVCCSTLYIENWDLILFF